MKREFVEPEAELIRLNVQDVITTSDGWLEEDELPWVPANP